MLVRGGSISFSDAFISILVGRGDVLDVVWVVSSGENIGRATYLNYASQRGPTISSPAFIARILVVDNNASFGYRFLKQLKHSYMPLNKARLDVVGRVE